MSRPLLMMRTREQVDEKFREDMGGQQDDFSLSEFCNERADFFDLIGIKTTCGFIQDEDGRIVNEGLCQSNSLLVSFGEL